MIVAVNHSIDPDRNYVGYVQAAINYWSGDGNEFTDYEARFVIKPNATDPDIVVRFVSSLKYCGSKFTNEEDIGGCASHLSKLANPDDPEVIRVLAGLTRESTLHVLKHEFGHIYGLGHSEPPYELMAGTYDYTFISKPDVADRPYPWQKDVLKVNVEYPSSFDETENESTKTQVQHALNYYEDGAEGWMETDVTFELVDDSNESDITIEFTENESIESSSLGQDYGTDIDTDDNLEYITYTYININRIELDRRGWHVGYWLGFAFGAKEVPDLPPAFDEPNDDPRTNWW